MALQNQAEDYAIACKIRALITAVATKDPDSQATKEWITWATDKADWFDPTIAKDDEFLGTRDHSKSEEQKQLVEAKSYYFF